MLFQFEYFIKAFSPIIQKLPTTLYMTVAAVLIAVAAGALLAVGMKCTISAVRIIVTLLNSFLKGVPVLVFLYLLNYSMDDIMNMLAGVFSFEYDLRNPPKILFAILGLALSYTPYMCDMFVTAYDTVPKGQTEACRALGLSSWQGMRRIIIPQMLVIAIPNFGNHFVNLLKATSFAYMVTILEMLGAARNYAVTYQRYLEAYIMAALIYWAVFIAFEYLFRLLEANCGRYMRINSIQKKVRRQRG